MTKDQIIAEIHRVAVDSGGVAPGRTLFHKTTGIREADWRGKYWARWGDAIREAGYEPNVPPQAHNDGSLIEPVIALIRRLGRLPTTAELRLARRRDSGFPSHGSIGKHLGNKTELAHRIIAHCTQRASGEDVIDICRRAITEPGPTEGLRSPTADGAVYLLKSGRYYKLGRASKFERRERQIALQLPERALTIHVIATDDPAGIEAYWHARFATRRRNGEWFELTPDDVRAFRRRRFM